MSNFVHLHVRSEHSPTGFSAVGDLVAAAVAGGQSHMALTDDTTIGFRACQEAADLAGISVIAGAEVLMLAPGGGSGPVVVLAENADGLAELHWLASKGAGGGAAVEDLSELSDVVVLTGGPRGPLGVGLAHSPTQVRSWLGDLADALGPERLFCEVVRAPAAAPDEALVCGLARDLGLGLVASADVCYAAAGEDRAWALLQAIRDGRKLAAPGAYRVVGRDGHMADSATMIERFGDLPEAITGAVALAERCDVVAAVPPSRPVRPMTHAALVEAIASGARGRWGDSTPPGVRARLVAETDRLAGAGLLDTVGLAARVVAIARERSIPIGPGRGSSVASAVCYALGITDVDPIDCGLDFDRFVGPGRTDPPDIDIDVADDRRRELLSAVADELGADCVARPAVVARLGVKGALRTAGRSLGVPEAVIAQAASLGARATNVAQVADALARRSVLGDPAVRRLLAGANAVFGRVRSTGAHPSAVVCSGEPLSRAGVCVPARDGGIPVLAIDAVDATALGLAKLDLLGSKVVRQIASAIAGGPHAGIVIPHPTPDDAVTWELLARGDTSDIYQLGSAGARSLVSRVAPRSISDLAAVIALWRPGPIANGLGETFVRRRSGAEVVAYPHPDAEAALGETTGVLCYQEQVTALAKQFAGFSPTEADQLRHACAKKDSPAMRSMRDRFISGCAGRGYTSAVATSLWNLIEPCSGYAFNRAHGVAYATQAWRMAWLKAHHPSAFARAVGTVPDSRAPLLRAELLGSGPGDSAGVADLSPGPPPTAELGHGSAPQGVELVSDTAPGPLDPPQPVGRVHSRQVRQRIG